MNMIGNYKNSAHQSSNMNQSKAAVAYLARHNSLIKKSKSMDGGAKMFFYANTFNTLKVRKYDLHNILTMLQH